MSDLNELFEDPSPKVEEFRSTYAMLKTSPDVDPPRRIFFEFEKPRTASWIWRWLAPMAASAAVAGTVVAFAPRLQQVPAPVIVVQAPAVQGQAAAQPVDYQKIIGELRSSERVWVANQLKEQEVARTKDLQRVHGQLAYLDEVQRELKTDTIQNTAYIGQLAQK